LPSPGVASERTVTIDAKAAKDPSLVERWIEDQREWQKTAMAYLDSMVKNDDFLVHLGNAMRGSLLAGKPYPTAPARPPAQEAPPTTDWIECCSRSTRCRGS
jgi:hypothetical protein